MKTFEAKKQELYDLLGEGEIDEDQFEMIIEELESEEWFDITHEKEIL